MVRKPLYYARVGFSNSKRNLEPAKLHRSTYAMTLETAREKWQSKYSKMLI